MTYQVKQIEQNSVTVDSDGKFHAVEKWDCGHNHRTLNGAFRCLRSLSGTTRSIGAWIYDSDGSRVDESDVYTVEYEMDNR